MYAKGQRFPTGMGSAQLTTKKKKTTMQTIHGIECGKKVAIEKARSSSKILHLLKMAFPRLEWVHDALSSMQINVTKGDIKGAKQGDFGNCAVACAARRIFKSDAAFIGTTMAVLVFGDTAVRFCVPASVYREITSWDRNGDFESSPNFRLSKVTPSRRLGRPQPKTVTPKKKAPVKNHGLLLASARTARVRKL